MDIFIENKGIEKGQIVPFVGKSNCGKSKALAVSVRYVHEGLFEGYNIYQFFEYVHTTQNSSYNYINIGSLFESPEGELSHPNAPLVIAHSSEYLDYVIETGDTGYEHVTYRYGTQEDHKKVEWLIEKLNEMDAPSFNDVVKEQLKILERMEEDEKQKI